MITASILSIFTVCAVVALGAGIVGTSLRILGGFLRVVFSLVGVFFIPFGIMFALAYGIGSLLPILIPVGLLLFLASALNPARV